MKKLICILCAASMIAAILCSCTGNEAKTESDNPGVTDDTGINTVSEPSEQTVNEDTASENTQSQTEQTEPVPQVTTTTESTVVSELASVPESVPNTEPTSQVTSETAASTELQVKPMNAVMYAKASVNVRSGPDSNYERLGHLDKGDSVEVTGICDNGWYRISYKGGIGFVGGSYLSADKPEEEQTSAAAEPSVSTVPVSEDKVETIKWSMSEVKPENHCPSSYTRKKSGVNYVKDWRNETDGRNEIDGGESYYSSVCKKNLPVYVVLPDGYDKPENKDKKYPVLYVLHGFFGHRYSMMVDSGCDTVIANMMADGTAEEMIVVYPHIYAFNSDRKQAVNFSDKQDIAAYDRFLVVIEKDLMPYMAKNYRVAEGRENTAVFGFSMGGRESLAIGFTYPDKFGYIGAVCPAPGLVPAQDWANKHEGQFKNESDVIFPDGKEPYLLMVAAADKDGVVGSFPEEYHKLFDRNKLEHVYYVVKDSDHGNPAIQSMTYNFVKNIFKAG